MLVETLYPLNIRFAIEDGRGADLPGDWEELWCQVAYMVVRDIAMGRIATTTPTTPEVTPEMIAIARTRLTAIGLNEAMFADWAIRSILSRQTYAEANHDYDELAAVGGQTNDGATMPQAISQFGISVCAEHPAVRDILISLIQSHFPVLSSQDIQLLTKTSFMTIVMEVRNSPEERMPKYASLVA